MAAAAAAALRDVGVVVSLAGTLEAADDATKMHATDFTTFQSPNAGSLGSIDEDGTVVLARQRGARRQLAEIPTNGARVELVQAGIGSDGTLIDAAVAAGAGGIVVAATGAGNTAESMLSAGKRAIDSGIAVVLASRCPAGAASVAYAFPGGGATWARAGAIQGGTLCAIKTRVALALGLGAGLGRNDLATLLADPRG